MSHAPWFAHFRPVCLHFLPKTCFRAHLVNDQIDQMRVWQLWGCVHAREPFIWYPTMSQHPRGTLDTITCHIGASTHAHSTPFARRATQIDQIQRRMAAVRLLHAREPLICYPAMGKHPRGALGTITCHMLARTMRTLPRSRATRRKSTKCIPNAVTEGSLETGFMQEGRTY